MAQGLHGLLGCTPNKQEAKARWPPSCRARPDATPVPPLAGWLWGAEAERGLPNPSGGNVSPISFRVLEQLGVGLAELGGEQRAM